MMSSPGHRHRRGSVYIVVLGTALVVTVIGLSALLAVRVQRQGAQGEDDLAEAAFYAQSAVEMSLFRIQQTPKWRQSFPDGVWAAGQPIGDGTWSLEVTDPDDGDLANSPADSIVMTGIGEKGQARHMVEVTLTAVPDPLDALGTCLHAGSSITVALTKSLTLNGAPLSSNDTIYNYGFIFGNVEAADVWNLGVISGTVTEPAPAKALPDPSTVNDYIAKATAIPFPDKIEKQVLAPGYNPWGATDPDGLYFIAVSTKDLVIKKSRIYGTLVVQCSGGNKVVLDDSVFLHNYRSDYPVLIVDGDLELLYLSDKSNLSESACGTNFNPIGAPYGGATDSDMLDDYPNEIQGLVHVTGTLQFEQTARVRGAIICEGSVICAGDNEIVHDPQLLDNPPEGYFNYTMQVKPGSWKQVVD